LKIKLIVYINKFYKGVPSSKTKYDIISDSGQSTVREESWKVILKAAEIFKIEKDCVPFV
jgi:hypothetical protein